MHSSQSINLFYCYAREDQALRDDLDTHLVVLKRIGLITTWSDREILPGTSWEEEIASHLNTADIILLLVSPDFMQSDYCYSREMERALERHRAKEAQVVPILLRPVDWSGTPFSQLQMIPTNASPIICWQNHDAAFADVTKHIRTVVTSLLNGRNDRDAEETPFPKGARKTDQLHSNPSQNQSASAQKAISAAFDANDILSVLRRGITPHTWRVHKLAIKKTTLEDIIDFSLGEKSIFVFMPEGYLRTNMFKSSVLQTISYNQILAPPIVDSLTNLLKIRLVNEYGSTYTETVDPSIESQKTLRFVVQEITKGYNQFKVSNTLS